MGPEAQWGHEAGNTANLPVLKPREKGHLYIRKEAKNFAFTFHGATASVKVWPWDWGEYKQYHESHASWLDK